MCKHRVSGFTIIELIVVIALLGIVAGISIPFYIDIKDQAIDKNVIGLSSAFHSSAITAHAAYRAGKSFSYPMTSNGWPGSTSMNTATCTTLWTELLDNPPSTSTSFTTGSNDYYVLGLGRYCYYLNMQSTSPLRYFIYNSSNGDIRIFGTSS